MKYIMHRRTHRNLLFLIRMDRKENKQIQFHQHQNRKNSTILEIKSQQTNIEENGKKEEETSNQLTIGLAIQKLYMAYKANKKILEFIKLLDYRNLYNSKISISFSNITIARVIGFGKPTSNISLI